MKCEQVCFLPFPPTDKSSRSGRFLGRELTLGQAFTLACLIEYGTQLPMDTSGYLEERKALFRSAAWYCLTDQQLETIFAHKELCVFLNTMVNHAKQYKYAIFRGARSFLAKDILCSARPHAPMQGVFWTMVPVIHLGC